MHREQTTLRMSFMVPLILFVLLFVLCSGVIACVFLQASGVSRDAETYNAAVTLCRNQAECYRAGEIPADGARHYFDAALQPVQAEQAIYCVTVTDQSRDTGAGQMHSGTVTVTSAEDKVLYRLDVAAYLPEGDSHGE